MNPNDHPHGGGEGRTGIGMKSPVTPGVNRHLDSKLVRKTTNPTNLLFVVVKNNVNALRFNDWP